MSDQILGRHAQAIETLSSEVEKLRLAVHELQLTIENMKGEVKGSWRTVSVVAAIASAIGAFIHKFWPAIPKL